MGGQRLVKMLTAYTALFGQMSDTSLSLSHTAKCREEGFHVSVFLELLYGQLQVARSRRVVVLLCGGDKSRQRKDVLRAKIYWRDYLMNKKG